MSEAATGVLSVERAFFPLNKVLGLGAGSWSPELARLAVWVGGQVSFAQAEAILREIGQMQLSDSSIWRAVEQWGGALQAQEQHAVEAANALPSREQPQAGESKHRQRMGVSLDGWMVHLREEGWKEVKLGVIYHIEQHEAVETRSGELVEPATATECSYVAHLGGPEPFGEKLWAEAQRRRLPGAYEKACVSDAANWIWNLCQDYFPEAEQIVDWYHALTHLHTAGQVAFSTDTAKATRWIEAQTTALYQGHAARIADQLETLAAPFDPQADTLRSEVTFFRNNARRMNYLEARENGWLIGSGAVESGCKQFQARLKGPGTHWSRPGAERMLVLSSLILSRRFHNAWRSLHISPGS